MTKRIKLLVTLWVFGMAFKVLRKLGAIGLYIKEGKASVQFSQRDLVQFGESLPIRKLNDKAFEFGCENSFVHAFYVGWYDE